MKSSPQETMGLGKDFLQHYPKVQNYLIKMYKLNSPSQVEDIKGKLLKNNVLIINAKELLEKKAITIEELKKTIDELKGFLHKYGGSVGRIGENYLILTPSRNIRISN